MGRDDHRAHTFFFLPNLQRHVVYVFYEKRILIRHYRDTSNPSKELPSQLARRTRDAFLPARARGVASYPRERGGRYRLLTISLHRPAESIGYSSSYIRPAEYCATLPESLGHFSFSPIAANIDLSKFKPGLFVVDDRPTLLYLPICKRGGWIGESVRNAARRREMPKTKALSRTPVKNARANVDY